MKYKVYCQSRKDLEEILEIYSILNKFRLSTIDDSLYVEIKSLEELDDLTCELEYPIIIGNYEEPYIEICDVSSINVKPPVKENELDGGDYDKFIVIKKEYIDDTPAQGQAQLLCEYADARRTIKTGKYDTPKYIVINTDEPYSGEIVNILKKNGHWGKEVDKNA